jgi:hypothetical protein
VGRQQIYHEEPHHLRKPSTQQLSVVNVIGFGNL